MYLYSEYLEELLYKVMTYQNFINYKILGRSFYCRDTSTIVKKLLRKGLIKVNGSENVGRVIVETEAYYGRGDSASYTFRGTTPRAEIMCDMLGISYVYLCYGMYYLLNVVAETKGNLGAVLCTYKNTEASMGNWYYEKKKDNEGSYKSNYLGF